MKQPPPKRILLGMISGDLTRSPEAMKAFEKHVTANLKNVREAQKEH